MPNIDLTKSHVPFWFGGSGSLRVRADVVDLDRHLAPTDDDLFSLGFDAAGERSFVIGAPESIKLGIDAGADIRLMPLWASSSAERLKILEDFGLQGYFDPPAGNQDRLLLLLASKTSADASVNGKFNYSALSTETFLKAGADAGYALLRSYPADTPARAIIGDFFRGLRLPANVAEPLSEDEVIVFEYGGYLRFGASLGVGYEMSGAASFEISQLRLAEKYAFSLMGKLSFGASVAGRFRIEVRQGTNQGWARVVVRKSHAKAFHVAADAIAEAIFEQEGLPETPDEFLSAIIGLNSKNWLNMLSQIRSLTDFDKLEEQLDTLAKSYIERLTGKAFDVLADRTQLDEALARINRIVDAYNDLGDHAVTLFDRYFDVARSEADDKLEKALRTIKEAAAWDDLKREMNSGTNEILWNVVSQFTEGDPLGWMLGSVRISDRSVVSLDEIKRRADAGLSLIRERAHAELRRAVALAKAEFPLDQFARELDALDWVGLKNLSDRRLVGFVERMIGKGVDDLGNSELGKAVTRFHETLDRIENFKTTAYGKIKEALDQSLRFRLHAEYSRATEQTALLDFEIDLTTHAGRRLMKSAGHGDFAGVLNGYDTGAVKLHEGVLSHKVTKQSKFSVNIIGWHLGWNYQGLDRIITQAEQRISATAEGRLTIISTFDLRKERERIRNGERVRTNLLLRFIGESKGKVLRFDPADQAYLVDAITGMTARYDLVIDDPRTTGQELAQYLSFADDFGLAASDEAAEAALVPLLPADASGNFGEISVKYEVRFTEEGLRTLFADPLTPGDEAFMRRVMRLIVLANSLDKGAARAARAWAYWTPGVQALWARGQAAFTNRLSAREFSPIAPSPLKNLTAPHRVTLTPAELQQLSTLFYIEESMIKGMRNLSKVVQSPDQLSLRDFEKRMQDFGDALKLYDDFDGGENTIFALFDKLIQRAPIGARKRDSSLTIASTVDGRKTTKMLFS